MSSDTMASARTGNGSSTCITHSLNVRRQLPTLHSTRDKCPGASKACTRICCQSTSTGNELTSVGRHQLQLSHCTHKLQTSASAGCNSPVCKVDTIIVEPGEIIASVQGSGLSGALAAKLAQVLCTVVTFDCCTDHAAAVAVDISASTA